MHASLCARVPVRNDFKAVLHCLLLAHVCFNSFQGKLSLRHPIQDPHQIHHGPDANTKCEGMNSFCLASCIAMLLN